MVLGIVSWIFAALHQSGEVTVDALGNNEPMLIGNIMAIGSSGIIHVLFSLARPQNYDFKTMAAIGMLENDQRGLDPENFTEKALNQASSFVQKWGCGFTLVMIIIWPVLSLPAGVFTPEYFAFWVFISLAWGFIAAGIIITLPIYESK